MHPAGRDDLAGLWPVVEEAHLFGDLGAFTRWWEAGPWRVRLSDRGSAVVLGRWREHLPYLSVLGLWCPRRDLAAALGDIREVALERGLERVVGPLVPEEAMRPYADAGFAVVERIVVCRRAVSGAPEAFASPGAELRPGDAGDIPRVLALDSACFNDFWRYDAPTLRALAAAGDLIVAESGSDVIGYTLWVRSGAESTIARLAVDPEQQGRGVGRALLREAVSQLTRAGSRAVTLTTQEDNDVSRRLYGREGFRESPGRLVCTMSSPAVGAGQAPREE